MAMTWALLTDHRTVLTAVALTLLLVPSGLSLDIAILASSARALIFQGHSKINTRDPTEGSGDRGTQPGLAVLDQHSISSLVWAKSGSASWVSGLSFMTVVTTEAMI